MSEQLRDAVVGNVAGAAVIERTKQKGLWSQMLWADG